MEAGIVTKEVEVLMDELQHISLSLTVDEAVDIGQFVHTLKYKGIDKLFTEDELEDIYKLDKLLDTVVKVCLEEYDQDGYKLD